MHYLDPISTPSHLNAPCYSTLPFVSLYHLHLSVDLFCTDVESEVIARGGEQIHAALRVCFVSSIQCTVISEQELSKTANVDLGIGLEASRMEELAVCSIPDVYAWVTVMEGIGKH